MQRPKLPTLSSLSRRERVLAAGAVFAVSVAVMWIVVLGPWWAHTTKVRREITRLEEQMRQQRHLLVRKPRLMAEAEAAGEAYRALESGGMDMAAVLRELEALGAESGMVLGEVKPIETATASGAGSTVDVKSQGSLKAWIHFLYVVQTSQSLFEIQRATVAVKDPETGVLEGSLRLTSPVVRLKESP